jgi:hypothetical protein
MGGYKHIEKCIGAFIAGQYRNAIEIGIGTNPEAAWILYEKGVRVRATDIRDIPSPDWLPFFIDDIFAPDLALYAGVDVLYAIRPAIEMVPSLITLAQQVNCDLLVFHLGFESWGDGGEIIDCGVPLHCYYRCQNPSNSVA